MKKTSILALALIVGISGCTTVATTEPASTPASDSAMATDGEQKFDSEAYAKGVADVLHDMRGRLSVNNDFVFMPPLKECGVWIPTSTINGVVVPAHETCVVFAPGYYVEKSTLYEIEGVKP